MLTVHLYLIYSQALHSLNKQVPKKWGERHPLQGMFAAGPELPSHLGGFRDGTANSEIWV